MTLRKFLYRLLSGLAAVCLGTALLPSFCRQAEALEEAKELTDTAQLTIVGGGASPALLTDSSYSTSVTFVRDGELSITSEEPIGAVYVVWQKAPEHWHLEAGGTTYVRGDYGFLHDTVRLEEPSNTVNISWVQDFSQLCDVYLFGEGALPDWVQQWQPPVGKADLLVLPVHAYDEYVYFGGLLPYCAERGDVIVQVAYQVNHSGEPYRVHELLAGLWKGGVTRYPVIPDFRDVSVKSLEAASSTYSRQEILAYQTSLIRQYQPLVVVGQDIHGEYGHGLHMLSAQCLLEVVERSADPDYFPESYQSWGGWQPSKLYLHLYGDNPLVMDWKSFSLSSFGGKSALAVARDCFTVYSSQVNWFSVADSGANDCRKFGLAFTQVGEDEPGDNLFSRLELPRIETDVQDMISAALSSTSSSSTPPPVQTTEKEDVSRPASSQTFASGEAVPLPEMDNPRRYLQVLAATAASVSLAVFLVLLIVSRKQSGKKQKKRRR